MPYVFTGTKSASGLQLLRLLYMRGAQPDFAVLPVPRTGIQAGRSEAKTAAWAGSLRFSHIKYMESTSAAESTGKVFRNEETVVARKNRVSDLSEKFL